MRIGRFLGGVAGFALTALLIVSPVGADSVPGYQVKAISVGSNGYDLAQSVKGTAGATSYTGQTVRFNWQRSGTLADNNDWPYAPDLGETFNTFCIQFNQSITKGTYVFNVSDLNSAPIGNGSTAMGADRANLLKYLWKQYYGLATTATNAAAFQIAIWEIIYENINLAASSSPFDVGGGSAKFDAQKNNSYTGASESLANTWLSATWSAYKAGFSGTQLANVWALTHANKQDQAFLVPGPVPGPLPVPLPASVWAGLVLLGGIGVTKLARRHYA